MPPKRTGARVRFSSETRLRRQERKIDSRHVLSSGARAHDTEGGFFTDDGIRLDMAELDKLDAELGRERLRAVEPDLHDQPHRARDDWYDAVGDMAHAIEQNIVRPANARVARALRRDEQNRILEAGPGSLAIYKSNAANDEYVSKGPMPWSNDAREALAKAREAAINRHTHMRSETLVLDALQLLVQQGIAQPGQLPPASFTDHIGFRYMCVPDAELETLQNMRAHNALLTTVAANGDVLAREQTLESLLRRVRSLATFDLFAVLLRRNGALDIVYSLEDTLKYFAVLACTTELFGDAPGAATHSRAACDEVQAERLKIEAEVERAQPTLMSTTFDRKSMQALHDKAEQLVQLFHQDYTDPQRKSTGDQLVIHSALSAHFRPELSRTLMQTRVSQRYVYFNCCQCCHDIDSLEELLLPSCASTARSTTMTTTTTTARPAKRTRTQPGAISDQDDDDNDLADIKALLRAAE